MNKAIAIFTLMAITGMSACEKSTPSKGITFGDDLAFLQEHTDVFVLSAPDDKAQLAIVPAYQGRVMTSTSKGNDGLSYGWINRELIASGEIEPHINAYGGEDRYWMGPEGGQYAIFFPPGAEFDLASWQTPPVIDTEPFELDSKTDDTATFVRQARFQNRFGTEFEIRVDRIIRLLTQEQASQHLGMELPDSLEMVVYESDNTLTNVSDTAWDKETGLLSIWILGMYNPSPQTTVVIPYQPGPIAQLGPIVNDEYFGKVPDDRLLVKQDVIFFKGDGEYRSKIGLTPQRAKPILGSYDAITETLTIVQYTKPQGATDYVNSMWEMQEEPYAGDVVNSYNDGPPEPGADPLGPFYELETSSPAKELASNESINHIHRTYHIRGDKKELDTIAQFTLGVSLAEITTAFE